MSQDAEFRFDSEKRQVQAWLDHKNVARISVPNIDFNWGDNTSIPMSGISAVSTDEDYRGRGLANAMMKKVVHFSMEQGYTIGGVSTNFNNVARRLYAKGDYTFLFSVDSWAKKLDTPLEAQAPSGITLRPYQTGDEVNIVELFNQCYGTFFGARTQTPQAWLNRRAETMQADPSCMALAFRKNELVGYMDYCQHWRKNANRNTFLLSPNDPDKDALGKGLLSYMEKHAKKMGLQEFKVDATHHQADIYNLLRHEGYNINGRSVFQVAIFDLQGLLNQLKPFFAKRMKASGLKNFPAALKINMDDQAAEVMLEGGQSGTFEVSGGREAITKALCGRVGAWQSYLRGHLKIGGQFDQELRPQLNILLGKRAWFHPEVGRW